MGRTFRVHFCSTVPLGARGDQIVLSHEREHEMRKTISQALRKGKHKVLQLETELRGCLTRVRVRGGPCVLRRDSNVFGTSTSLHVHEFWTYQFLCEALPPWIFSVLVPLIVLFNLGLTCQLKKTSV